MSDTPTLIFGSLSDDKLKESIDALVEHVHKGMKDILEDTNDTIDKMERKINSLESINIKKDSTDASERIQNNKKEEDSIKSKTKATEENISAKQKEIKLEKEKRLTLDQTYKALRLATGNAPEVRTPDLAKSAKESFAAIFKNNKDLIAQLDKKIQEAEAAQAKAVSDRIANLEQKLNKAKSKLHDFYTELERQRMKAEKEGDYSTDNAGITRAKQSIEYQQKHIQELQQQMDIVNKLSNGQSDSVQRLRAERERVAGLLRDEGNLQKQNAQSQAQAQQQAAQSAQRYTEEIRKQATAIRESQQWREKGFVQVDGQVIYNKENESKRKRVALEEQILQLQQQGLYLKQDQATKEIALVDAEGRRIRVIQEGNENLQRQKERVAEIAKEVRESFNADQWSAISYTPAPLSGVRWIYQENDARAKGLTIEQQIEKILKEQSDEYERQAKSKGSSNSNAQRNLNDIQAQTRAIEELLKKGKDVALLGNYKLFPEDMSGVSVAKQIALYEEQRKAGLIASNRELNIQVELANAIAQAEGRITQEQEKRKKYIAPTSTDDYNQILRNAVANKLGIDPSKVINADAQYDSARRLGGALKQLQDAYSQMSNEERKSPIGKQTLRQMQELERQTQQLRKEMSRPVSLEAALGGSEKTLDDIAYKIQRLQSYMQGLDTSNEKSAEEFKRGALNVKLLQEKESELLEKNSRLINSNNRLFESNTALGRSWNYMKNRLAFYLTVGAFTQFVRGLTEVRAQYEMNERALGILIGNAEKGTVIFNKLSQMSLISPYTLIELSDAAKQLTAYNIAAKDVVDTTRRLADMSSAVGVPLERMTYALGQIKAYGYLNSRDARMFTNAGIPIVKELANYYSELEGKLVTTGDVYEKMEGKMVSYTDVMGVVNKMTDEGGRFFNFQAKMADTLKTQLANLTLAYNNMLNEIGESNQGILVTSIKLLKELFLSWGSIQNTLTTVAVVFGVVKGAQMLANIAIGKQTVATLKYVEANKLATAEDYRRALSLRNITTEQARWLVLTNQTNRTLLLSIVRMGLLDAASVRTLARFTGFRKGLDILLLGGKMAARGLVVAFKSIGAALISNWPMLLLAVGASIYQSFTEADEKVREFNKDLADGAKENYNSIKEYLENAKELRDRVTEVSNVKNANGKTITFSTHVDINEDEANKAWTDMKSQIENATSASEEYISRLLQIKNVSQRLSEGFNILQDIQSVNAAMKELGDTAIKVDQKYSAWWNAWLLPDGVIENIKDYEIALENAQNKQKSLFDFYLTVFSKTKMGKLFAAAFPEKFGETEVALKRVDDGVKTLTDSIEKTIATLGAADNPTKVLEIYNKSLEQVISQQKLNADQELTLRRATESSKAKMMRASLNARIADEKAALALTRDENKRADIEARLESLNTQKALFSKNLDASRPYWDSFTKYLKEQHISELTAAYNKMTDNGKKAMNYHSKEWNNYVKKWAQGFARQHKKSFKDVFDKLKAYVKNANLMNIFIPLTISSDEDKKSLYDTLKAGDDRLDQINTEIQRLKRVNKNSKNYKQAQIDINNLMKERAKLIKEDAYSPKEEKQNEKARKAAERAKSKAERERLKEQREQESELQKAFNSEIQLIDKIRSHYDKLTSAGVSSTKALESATRRYGNTIEDINKIFRKNGIPTFSTNIFKNAQDQEKLLEFIDNQIKVAKKAKNVKAKELKDLEMKYQDISVDKEAHDATVSKKMVESELSSIKDEYEFSLSVQENPELGKALADALKIDITNLPKDAREYAERLTEELNLYFKERKKDIHLPNLLDISKEQIEELRRNTISGGLEESYFNMIEKSYKDANNALDKELSSSLKNYDKLLEKYSEYQYKIKQIGDEANRERVSFVEKFGTNEQKSNAKELKTQIDIQDDEDEKQKLIEKLKKLTREVAGSDNAKIQLTISINTQEAEQKAQTAFEEFKKSPEWLIATGNLAGMTNKSIKMLISSIRAYKKEHKNLGGKQSKEITKTLDALHKQLQSGNPFETLIDTFAQAKERAEDMQPAIDNVKKKIAALDEVRKKNGKLNENQLKQYDGLKNQLSDLVGKQKEFGKVDSKQVVGGINKAIAVSQAATEQFNNMMQALAGKNQTAASDTLNDIMGNMQAAGQGAAVGASFGGPWGAAIGAIAAGATDLVSRIFSRKDKDISRKIKQSELEVSRLNNVYKNLTNTVDGYYGVAASGAKSVQSSMKALELAELQRQLQLEKSRKAKNRDEQKIISLEGQIDDLKNEVSKSSQDIINDLLGISSAGDGITSLVQTMVEAFKNGEDAMDAFGKKWDEMIDNMILKLIVTQYMSRAWDGVMDTLKKKEDEMTGKQSKSASEAYSYNEKLKKLSDEEVAAEIREKNKLDDSVQISKQRIAQYRKDAEDDANKKMKELEVAEKAYNEWSLNYMNTTGHDIMYDSAKQLENSLTNWYSFGQDKNQNLSALQQGIQGVTEDTAGALEAYMNGVSQQVYLHTDLLTQIRDAVNNLSSDERLGMQAQMLLQLQQSYQVQQSINSTLQGVLNPSGRAFNVELLS